MKYLVSLLQIVLYQLHFILFQLHLIDLYIANGIFPRRLEVHKGYFFIQVSGKRGNRQLSCNMSYLYNWQSI